MNHIGPRHEEANGNDSSAGALRARLAACGVLCVNLLGAPGSGKTSLLECTLETLPRDADVAVLTGDVQTQDDAKRLRRYGFPVRQINTGGAGCLDVRMTEEGLADWRLEDLDLLLIENVGNLIGPAKRDLGETAKIVLLSVTEGEDEPLKYPSIFQEAELMLLTKIDLLPYVPFDLEAAENNVRRVNPGIDVIRVSCMRKSGIAEWRAWLAARREKMLGKRAPAV